MKLQITIEGKAYEVDVEVLEDDATLRQQSYPSYQPMQYSSTPAQLAVGEDSADESKVCRSPVTGLVIKVEVAAGQSVKANERLMVLEAMKMETNVTAPGDGKIKSVNVAAGNSVKLNQVIVEFE